MADLVVWRPAFFGIKPELVIKGGFIAWGAMGDTAASLMTCEPILLRPQWGAFGRAAPALVGVLRASAGDRSADSRASLAVENAACPRRARATLKSPTCCTTLPARTSGSIRRPSRSSPTACLRPASRQGAAARPALHAAMKICMIVSRSRAKQDERYLAPPASASAARSAPARPR